MNRLLGQQPKLTTHHSPRSPSSDSVRSPQSTAVTNNDSSNTRMGTIRSPSADPIRRANSPHIASQALSPPAVSRKPVDGARNMSSPSEENRYRFTDDDTTPNPSARNTMDISGVDSLEMDPQVKLENYDWAELEDQFAKRMEAFRAEEDGIWEEWKGWGEIFKAWASTISVHDEERAAKRLRTRIAFTQGSEESLEAKRMHYIKVVQAFESALQLLGSRHSAHNFI